MGLNFQGPKGTKVCSWFFDKNNMIIRFINSWVFNVFLCVKGDLGLQGPPGPPGQVGEVSGLPDTVIQQGEKVTSFIYFKPFRTRFTKQGKLAQDRNHIKVAI